MSEIIVRTNHHVRPLLHWDELTPKQREQAGDSDPDGLFILYHNWTYMLSDFCKSPLGFASWDGVLSETAFSGVLIQLISDDECIMGNFYQKG